MSDSVADATKDIKDGSYLCVGGCNLVEAVRNHGIKNLTVASNNYGVDYWGLGLLLKSKQVKRIIASYMRENKNFEE